MKGYIINPDKEIVSKIIDGIYRKDGHCPCRVKVDETTLCPCDEFIETGNCICKLYLPIENTCKVKCDVAFVPVDGTYTMDFKEAAYLINKIEPKIAVPIHYGSIVGTSQDANEFVKLLHSNIKGVILMK